ncbi:MAG: FecR domain-containing protein [Myxococcota bacterium]
MNERPSFLDELRRVDEVHQSERLRPGAVHRITRRLDAELLHAELPTRRRAFIPMASFAAGAALVLAVFAFGDGAEQAHEEITADVPVHASWLVGGSNCHATRGKVELVLDGSCRVQTSEPGLTIESRKTTRLRAVEHGVELRHGIALFEVEPVTEGAPWRVEVPGGAIEVMGTRFSVVVNGDHGHVDLLEGAIQFVGHDGRVHRVQPGERFRFSATTTVAAADDPAAGAASSRVSDNEAAPTDSTAEADEGAPLAAGELLAALGRPDREGKARGSRGRHARARNAEALTRLVSEITELRAQRQYQAAVSLLRGALSKRWDRHTREVLSYELGTVLSTQLPNRDDACAHWAEHTRQFSGGRYARAIERATERLGCP